MQSVANLCPPWQGAQRQNMLDGFCLGFVGWPLAGAGSCVYTCLYILSTLRKSIHALLARLAASEAPGAVLFKRHIAGAGHNQAIESGKVSMEAKNLIACSASHPWRCSTVTLRSTPFCSYVREQPTT